MSVHDTSLDYAEMNRLASTVPVGADGLVVLPYGNGAERTLGNRDIGASFHGLSFNTHTKAHLLRATQEGIVFALQYGLDIMQNLGISVTTVRAGNANMFLSPLFAEAFATISGAHVELYDTDGSQGAARGAGIGAGIYPDVKSAFTSLNVIRTIEPNQSLTSEYKAAYQRWLQTLNKTLA